MGAGWKVALAGLLVAGVTRAEAPPDWIDKERRTIEASIAALNRHDAPALAALYAEDVTLGGVGAHGWEEEHGRAVVEADHRRLFAHIPDVKFAARHIYLTRGAAILEWSSSGTDTEGKVRGFHAASLFSFDSAGRIATDHTYFDAAARAPLSSLPQSAVQSSSDLGGDGERAALLRKMYAARAARRDSEVAALFATDAVVSSLYEPIDLAGRAGLARALAESKEAIASLTVEPTRVFSFGPFVAAEAVVHARLADGHTVIMHSLDIAQIDRGLIRTYTSYGDGRELR
jgi:ketosteroid isomerase-like protein